MITIAALLTAVLLDKILGEPKYFHPLIGFGNIALWLEKTLNRPNRSNTPAQTASQKIAAGSFAWILAIIPIVVFSSLFINASPWLYYFFATLTVYVCIAHQSLILHNQAILTALNTSDISGARNALALVVSRDTHNLDEAGIRKAAIESVLENGSDAIFAPIFWFLLLGIPGIVLYRGANTLDAMWGYRNERFNYFGRCSAKIDDYLNWIPARIVAFSYALLGDYYQAIKSWRTQAHLCSSPNAGPVMSAGAGALNLALGGTAIYHGTPINKPQLGFGVPPQNSDLTRAIGLVSKTLWFWLAVVLVVSVAVNITFSLTTLYPQINWLPKL